MKVSPIGSTVLSSTSGSRSIAEEYLFSNVVLQQERRLLIFNVQVGDTSLIWLCHQPYIYCIVLVICSALIYVRSKKNRELR